MQFNSLGFLVFFPVVVICYFLLPSRVKPFWLLIVSYYFYMCWNARYVLLLIYSTAVTYFSGLLLEYVKKCESIVKRRKRKTNDAARMRMTLWKKNSSNYTAPFANAMIADFWKESNA